MLFDVETMSVFVVAFNNNENLFGKFCMQHAFQIRQSPFSDDSCSDSSDIDQPNGLVPSLSSRDNRMSERNTNSRRPAAAHKSTANRSVSREGSCSSLASETSSDYAFPPEDGASVKTDNSDMCLATSAAKSATAASLDSYKKVHFVLLQ